MNIMFYALHSNIKFLVLFETSMCILTWYAAIILQCSTSMVEDSSLAFASMKCQVVSSDEGLTSFDEPTTTDNDKMEELECALEM